MNVLYITGRLLKAFQIDFNWYHLASWVNLTEQWPFRTSWIIYHHETYEEHIDDNTSLKHIYDKIRPNIPSLRDAEPLMELDRDERKLDVFLNFHRHSLLAADLKIFLPFTINLDPYIKKVIKEEHHQYMAYEDMVTINLPQFNGQQKYSSKYYQRKSRHQTPPPAQVIAPAVPSPPVWLAYPDGTNYGSLAAPAVNVQPSAQLSINGLKTNFPSLGDVSNVRLSRLTVNEVCEIVRRALPSTVEAARESLLQHNVCGMVLAHCNLNELKSVLNLNFGDWELFKMLVLNLKELEQTMPLLAPVVNVVPEKTENEKELKPRPSIDTQRNRPSNMEKQVTLEEQMICGALQTLNEEALEDVLQGEPVAQQGETSPPLPTITEYPSSPSESFLESNSLKYDLSPVQTFASPPVENEFLHNSETMLAMGNGLSSVEQGNLPSYGRSLSVGTIQPGINKDKQVKKLSVGNIDHNALVSIGTKDKQRPTNDVVLNMPNSNNHTLK